MEPIISALISLANQRTSCKHIPKSICNLLLTCSTFNKRQNELIYKRLLFGSCNNQCRISCEICIKNRTFKCKKCICINCNQSQNTTNMWPEFNKCCWECANLKWGANFDLYRYREMPAEPIIFNIINIHNQWPAIIESMISIGKIRYFETIKSLLLTCKDFSTYLPLKSECLFGNSGLYCDNCLKLGVLRCEMCTCSYCGYSENVTREKHNYKYQNLLLCRKCAKKKWGKSMTLYQRQRYFFPYGYISYMEAPEGEKVGLQKKLSLTSSIK